VAFSLPISRGEVGKDGRERHCLVNGQGKQIPGASPLARGARPKNIGNRLD
jgi:hypothetical protein